MALRPVTQGDFSGGVNAVANPFIVTKKQVWRIRNLILDEHGSLRTRDGYKTVQDGTAPFTAPILLVAQLRELDGTVTNVAIESAGGGSELHKLASPWTSIGTFTTNYLQPQAVIMAEKLIFALGYEVPRSYDGTTLALLTAGAGQTVPPGANHLAHHLGSLWVWNTKATTDTLDGPSSIRMSTSDDPNDWPNANQAFISKDDGQVGMGLGTYTIVEAGISPTQTLVAFKNFSAYQITGVFGASTFSIQQLKTDMGCIAPRSVQFLSGFGIVRLSHKGFSLYNGIDDRLLSEEIRPYIFGRDEIEGIDFNNAIKSMSAQSQNPPLYICGCTTLSGGGILDRLFIYDLVRKAWTICDIPELITTFANIPDANSAEVRVWAGTTNALPAVSKVIRVFSGDTTDNGELIDWNFRSAPKYIGSFMRQTYWRRAIFDMLVTPIQHITIAATLLGITGVIERTYEFNGLPTTRWGAWPVVPLPGVGLTYDQNRAVDVRRSFSIQRTAPAVYFEVSGRGNVRIRGIEWQGSPQPLTRVSNQ